MNTAELPLLTGQKVGNVGKAFPTFIQEAPMLQTIFKIEPSLIFRMIKCQYYSDIRIIFYLKLKSLKSGKSGISDTVPYYPARLFGKKYGCLFVAS